MYTLSIGIKSSHPAKSTAASTAGGCWPTEAKQTRRSVQLQSLPLIWRGKGSCETRSYLRHQMKGAIQQWRQRPPCRHCSEFPPKVLLHGQRQPVSCQVKRFEGKMALLQPGPDAASPEVSGSLSTDVSGLWTAPLGFRGPSSPSAAVSQMQADAGQAEQRITTPSLEGQRVGTRRAQQEREGAAERQLGFLAVALLC